MVDGERPSRKAMSRTPMFSAFQISMRMRSSGCTCRYFFFVIHHTLPNGKVLHFGFEAAKGKVASVDSIRLRGRGDPSSQVATRSDGAQQKRQNQYFGHLDHERASNPIAAVASYFRSRDVVVSPAIELYRMLLTYGFADLPGRNMWYPRRHAIGLRPNWQMKLLLFSPTASVRRKKVAPERLMSDGDGVRD